MLATLVMLLVFGISSLLGEGTSDIWSLGLGSVNGQSILNFNDQSLNSTSNQDAPNSTTSSSILLQMVLLANLPQLIMSVLYFVYNGMFTCMLSSVEWSHFAPHRKPFRVTSPTQSQRSTYWLSLPWTYGLPLTLMSSLMHWLVSQSIFLVKIDFYDPRGTKGNNVLTCGYSAYAMVILLISGSAMILVLILNGFRKLDGGIPLVGSCSLAISAACHRPPWDTNAAYEPVQWGAVSHETSEGPGHCCLTSFAVEPPIPGQHYAGYSPK